MDTGSQASGLATESAKDMASGKEPEDSSTGSPLSDPPSTIVTPEAERYKVGGLAVQNSTQGGSRTTLQLTDYTTLGTAGTAAHELEDLAEDGPPAMQDDSRVAFDQKVQKLLIDLEDEVGVDLLLSSGDHDSPECLAVKVIWQERTIAHMAQKIRRLEGKIRDMSAMTLEVMEKEISEKGVGMEQ